MKVCRICNTEKELNEFRVQKKKYGDWTNSICKFCENEKTSKRYYDKKAKQPKVGVVNMEYEYWVDIKGYEGFYQVSNKLRVKSLERYINAINNHSVRLKSEKVIKVNINKQNGYPYVKLYKNWIAENVTMHTLIAKVFIPNPDNLPEVNHKNANITDYSIDNLEWCTSAYNTQYMYEVMGFKYPVGEKNKLSKLIVMIHPDGKEEKIKGVTEAARRLGSKYTAVVSNVLCGKRNSYKGYKFKYAS